MGKHIRTAVQFGFKKYSALHPTKNERRLTWAVRVMSNRLRYFKERWPGTSINPGDYALLKADGEINVMTNREFNEFFPNFQIEK